MSRMGLGCWAAGGPAYNLGVPTGWANTSAREILDGIDVALQQGIRYFDVADVYGLGHAERLLGRALKGRRTDVMIGTKLGYFRGTAANAYHPRQMETQFLNSLDNLQTDYVDILSFHNDHFGQDDRYLGEAVSMMRKWKRSGRVRAIGLRTLHVYTPTSRIDGVGSSSARLSRFEQIADAIQPDVIQMKYNMLCAPAPALRVARWSAERGIDLLLNKPLAQGLLLDKYDPRSPPRFAAGDHRSEKQAFAADRLRALRERLDQLREKLGIDRSELLRLALGYARALSPDACVVVGFTSAEQVQCNAEAFRAGASEAEIDVARSMFAPFGDASREDR